MTSSIRRVSKRRAAAVLAAVALLVLSGGLASTALAAKHKGAEGRLGGIIEAAVELFGNVIFQRGFCGHDAHAVEAHLAVEAFEIKSAAIDVDAAEAQIIEGIVPRIL